MSLLLYSIYYSSPKIFFNKFREKGIFSNLHKLILMLSIINTLINLVIHLLIHKVFHFFIHILVDKQNKLPHKEIIYFNINHIYFLSSVYINDRTTDTKSTPATIPNDTGDDICSHGEMSIFNPIKLRIIARP